MSRWIELTLFYENLDCLPFMSRRRVSFETGGTVVVAKTGMGSSAALTSSLVGGLLSFFGAVNLPCVDGSLLKEGSTETPSNDSKPDEITSCPGSSKDLDLTHNLAQACHCVAQGKVR